MTNAAKYSEESKTPTTTVVVKLSADEKKKVSSFFSFYGRAKQCAESTGIHRTTITRVKKTGEATETVKERILAYIKDWQKTQSAA